MQTKLIMLVGVAGAGKSTVAAQIQSHISDILLFSSDDWREKLYGDSTTQQHNGELFMVLQKEIIHQLKNCKSVLYDATNLNHKRRMAFLKTVPSGIEKICVIVTATEQTCCSRQVTRDRIVPSDIIHKQCCGFQVPTYREGWHQIFVVNTDDGYDIDNIMSKLQTIPHDNPHHSGTIGEHNMAVGHQILKYSNNDFLINVGLVHDIGKYYTRTVDQNKIAHFYGHASYGAYMLLSSPILKQRGAQTEDLLELAFFVEHHMDLFDIQTKEQEQKWSLRNQLDSTDVNLLYILHKADIDCSVQDQDWSTGKGLYYGNMGDK